MLQRPGDLDIVAWANACWHHVVADILPDTDVACGSHLTFLVVHSLLQLEEWAAVQMALCEVPDWIPFCFIRSRRLTDLFRAKQCASSKEAM